ncbi:MAG: tRNA (adenosine(37)-N6)-threonylcarbamoyltransferase complex dimerization subunit type 1 TsaB [Lachnospiraceae bacterium]|nr:tRNA (adenosine(37)-N6)-threonylcarbamoyltransferase complex dimerization subunit type 1 TsaB [Lachnospiraceae bacterium]
MKLLAIDSSGLVASVAFLEDSILLAEYTVNYKKTHSQTLLPMLDAAATMIDMHLKTLDAIAVAGGPGSFTGLRIGSATAKGLGLALNKPLISVPTVEALAYNLYDTEGLVCPMLDARRFQVYTGIYRFKHHKLITVMSQTSEAVVNLAKKLNALGESITFLGDGAVVYWEMLQKLLKVPFTEAPLHLNKQRAGALGVLALRYYEAGEIQTAREYHPTYLSLSQAERERIKRELFEMGAIRV